MLSLTFLGTAASIPTVDRNVPGLAIQREGETILFDCGEGTQRQMMRYGVGFTFREVFFTHYHADHLLGITGLLRTMGLQDRASPLVLYGPKGAQKILSAAISLGIERNKFPVEIQEVRPGDRLGRQEYDLVVFETEHRADTVGYALVEHLRLGRFNPERARELGIPEGPLWGRLHKGETVSLADGRTVRPADLVGEPRNGRTLVYSGDTRPTLSVIEAAKGADLLVHEATFGSDELERARETGHSTAAEAARVALEAGVRRLLLTHISSRYNRDASELLAEARAVFPETVIARDGMTVDVPYADAVESIHDAPR
ncbi:MAG TPA: ribonuclease Z [Gemmatimonadales bacterium]|jgi:ribonuclease Z|nr:ribonuclease Z [Gemmatimonadales bacterium]